MCSDKEVLRKAVLRWRTSRIYTRVHLAGLEYTAVELTYGRQLLRVHM